MSNKQNSANQIPFEEIHNGQIALSEDFISKNMGDYTVLLHKKDVNVMVKLNETASFVFSCVKNGLALQEIVKEFRCRYGVSETVAEEDVSGVLAQLTELGVVLTKKEEPHV